MQKIIERIQKLLALAGNNPNENEAAAAIEKAHALLAEHNLDMASVEAHERKSSTVDEERVQSDFETNYSEKHWKWIWHTVATAHYCKMLSLRPNPKMRQTFYYVIGRKVNTIIAAQMALYLCETIKRLANDEAKRQGRSDHAFKNAFIAGACARLARRVQEMRWGNVQQANALVLWNEDEAKKNQAFIDEKYGNRVRAHKDRESRYDRDGYVAGDRAGRNVSLAQQVGGGRAPEAKKISAMA